MASLCTTPLIIAVRLKNYKTLRADKLKRIESFPRKH